jgi:hypothetical protein
MFLTRQDRERALLIDKALVDWVSEFKVSNYQKPLTSTIELLSGLSNVTKQELQDSKNRIKEDVKWQILM